MKQGWEIKKLGEVVQKIFAGGDKPLIFSEQHTDTCCVPVYANGVVNNGLCGYTDHSMVTQKCLTVSARGTIGFCCVRTEPFVPIVRLITIIPNNVIICEYLYYAISNVKIENNGVAIPQLTVPMIKEVKIPVPPIAEQEKIVAELDCLSGIIEKKKQQLKELDNLAQSIFYEMFGDPIENDKGWEVQKLGDICAGKKEIKRASKHFASVDTIHYIDIASIDNIENHITGTTEYTFSEAPSRAQQVVTIGDILISLVRPNLKNIAMVQFNDDLLVASSGFCVVRANNKSDKRFIRQVLLSDRFTSYLLDRVSGANYPAVREDDIRDCKLGIPPLALQQDFASKIEAIEKQKELIKQSIQETETLFKSRMDYYFN